MARNEPVRPRTEVRRELETGADEKLVLVTTGGGEDGYRVLENYLNGLTPRPPEERIKSLVVTGPELAPERAQAIRRLAQACPSVRILDFTDDMMSYINAADVVVSMAGYNTICEILTLKKRAVVVPRVYPVEEQRIRAERMSARSLFKMILPSELNPESMRDAVTNQLRAPENGADWQAGIDLGALPRLTRLVLRLVDRNRRTRRAGESLTQAALVH